jgi:hypothetical protein
MQLHKPLKRFTMEGEFGDDARLFSIREQFEAFLRADMRDQGYAPVLELGPFWSTEYIEAKDKYKFVVTIHGYKVGREVACQIEGITGAGKLIPLSTPPSKSKMSSCQSE